jgi:hypothetical protein
MDKLTLLDMFKHGTATWSAVSSFVVVFFWCVGCWLAFLAIVNYKNAADGKSGIAKPIVQTVIASLMVAISRFIPILDTLNNKAAEFSPQSYLVIFQPLIQWDWCIYKRFIICSNVGHHRHFSGLLDAMGGNEGRR